MSWFTRKLDSLVGAVFAAVGGASASQFDAFVQQYLQRLGGHRDEAARSLARLMDPDQACLLGAVAHEALIENARARLAEIDNVLSALTGADVLLRPFVFLRDVDTDIALNTLAQFRPVVPVDLAGLVFAAVGLAIGLIVYELIKAPFALAFRKRRRARRFEA